MNWFKKYIAKYIFGLLFLMGLGFQATAQLNNEWIDYAKTYYKFSVGQDGLFRIEKAALDAASLGNVPVQQFQLFRNGAEVPLFTSAASGSLPAGGYIEFIGRGNDGKTDRPLYFQSRFQLADRTSLFTDTASYFLTVKVAGNNLRYQNLSNNLGGTLPLPLPYLLHSEWYQFKRTNGGYFMNKGFAVDYGEYVYSSSYDEGEMPSSQEISPGSDLNTRTASFTNLHPALSSGISAKIRIGWAGTSPGSREVTASLNNTRVISRRLQSFQSVRDSNVLVPINLLSGNSPSLVLNNTSTNQFDRFVGFFAELEYPRLPNASNQSFFETSIPANTNSSLLSLAQFNHNNGSPVLYNLTSGYRMEGVIQANGDVRFLLPPASSRQYIVVTVASGSSLKTVGSLQSKTFTNYSQAALQGDYLIITNKRLLGGNNNAIEAYRQYRASVTGGAFNVKIYDIEELVDQFGLGIKMHPLSIKNFLRFARTRFATAPKFCFLIGKGVTYDEFRINESNALAGQLQLVPTYGNPGSDNLLASEGLTALPATPIGRLSVINTNEILDYLNKVKEFEGAQANPSNLQADKAWMKNVVHVVGANDANTELQIRPFMNEYTRTISDTLFGANVSTFNKFNSTTASTIENVVLSRKFESGISLLTYFGHSSATALDYNLDNPNEYNNPGKYPMFLLNGCNAGNFFNFEIPRLQTQATISERYVLAPNRGAIGLVASTHFGLVSGLGVYSRGFYRSVASQSYNQPIGKHIQNAIQFMYNTWGTDYQARFHTEQQTLHGDPAVKLNSFTKPDYSIEQSNIIIEPSFVSIAETNFKAKIFYYNLGRSGSDSIVVEVKRQLPASALFPNGNTEVIYRQKRAAPMYLDSLTLSLPILSERDKGINNIIVTLDVDNKMEELSELNNSITRQVVIFENELRPVSPANFAIVRDPTIKLIASTANPFSEQLPYVVEIDTTDLFNSSAKITRNITTGGGIVEIEPGITPTGNRVYYWRMGLQGTNGTAPARWNSSSFVYLAGNETGFNQSHFYQHTKSTANRISIDTNSRSWSFNPSLNNLFVTHSIFPTSGNEDSHFAVTYNNNQISTSACVGHSIIINVFDSLTFKPMRNMGNWGTGSCANNRNPFNFEWDDRVLENRKRMVTFLDAVPSGSYILVRKILDAPYENETFADKLKADEQVLGLGNSLYSRLKQAGFANLDSFNRPRTYIFVYKKNDPRLAPVIRLSDGLFDRLQLNLNLASRDTLGIVSSPVFGPAKQWKTALWNGTTPDDGSGDRVAIRVIGLNANGTETRLFEVDKSLGTLNLSSINPRVYPNIRLEMLNIDSLRGTPWNLNYWRVYYDPVPEGALAANLLLQDKDSLVQGETLDFKIAFKNISTTRFDSLKVRMTITDKSNVTTERLFRRKPLIAGDTLIISTPFDTRQFPGLNTLYLVVNPDNDQPEQYLFNNFLYKSFYVGEDLTDPLLDVTFDGVHILNRDIVSAKPHIQIKLKDENPFLALNDTAGLTIRLKYPNENIARIYSWNSDTLRFTPPVQGGDNTATIDFYPELIEDTEGFDYELSVIGKDRNNNRAGDKDYRVTFQVFNKPMISNLLNYPNPFSTSTAFVFTITGAEVPQEFKIQILTVTGKIVKEITKAELGDIRIGTNITDYNWDGTDMFGQKLANGVYLYRVISSLDGQKMNQFKINDGFNQNAMDNTDKFFKKGYGKMVILR